MDEREDPIPVQSVPIDPPEKVEEKKPERPAGPVGWRKLLAPKALAIIIPALASAGITWFEFFRGEPEAEEAQEYVSGPIKNELAAMEKPK